MVESPSQVQSAIQVRGSWPGGRRPNPPGCLAEPAA